MACSNEMDQAVDETELIQEISRLRKLEKNLNIRLFKLKSKLYISRPLSFQEYEELVPQSRPVYTDAVVAYNLNLLAKMYKLCGIQFTEANKNFFRAELTVVSGDLFHVGFFVELQKMKELFQVGAFHIPNALDMNEIEKHTPLKTYEDMTVFLQFLHRCISAFFHRRQQVKEFKDLCKTYDINAEVFATHNMKYLELKVAANDFIVSDVKSLVSFCFFYNMDSLIPTYGSFVQKDMTDDDINALHVCVDYFMGEHLPSALSNITNEKNNKKEVLHSSNSKRTIEQAVKHKVRNSIKGEGSLVPVGGQVNLSSEEEDKVQSSSSIDISSITTSDVGKIKEPVKKSGKRFPIAESTPFAASKRHLRSSSPLKKNEVETATVEKSRQKSIQSYLLSRNKHPEENTTNVQKESNMNRSDLSRKGNRKGLPNVTNPHNSVGTCVVLSNSYEETPVYFSKPKLRKTGENLISPPI